MAKPRDLAQAQDFSGGQAPVYDSTTGDFVGHALSQVPTSLPGNETIRTGMQAVIYGQLTIPANVTLTIEGTGQLICTNVVMTQ